ncbi:MAG: hypothetical protein DDT40_00836 [candidate division WS2 bacterium]|nr:hypothetical protein [Candidatus Psychracetigena formicireducens]
MIDPWPTETEKHNKLQLLINRMHLNPSHCNRETAKKDYIDLYQRTPHTTKLQKQTYHNLLKEIAEKKMMYNVKEDVL